LVDTMLINTSATCKPHVFVPGKRKKKVKNKPRKHKRKKRPQDTGVLKKYKGESRKVYYNRYIRSKVWFKKRKRIVKEANNKCIVCDEEALHVHHWRYPSVFGKEEDSWLSAVCYRCHELLHKDYKYDLKDIQNSTLDLMPSLVSMIIDSLQEDLLNREVSGEYCDIVEG